MKQLSNVNNSCKAKNISLRNNNIHEVVVVGEIVRENNRKLQTKTIVVKMYIEMKNSSKSSFAGKLWNNGNTYIPARKTTSKTTDWYEQTLNTQKFVFASLFCMNVEIRNSEKKRWTQSVLKNNNNNKAALHIVTPNCPREMLTRTKKKTEWNRIKLWNKAEKYAYFLCLAKVFHYPYTHHYGQLCFRIAFFYSNQHWDWQCFPPH